MKRTADDILSELLVLRCKEGDVDAWRQLVSCWQQRLYAHARRLTGEREAAHDVAQEAWLAMARNLGGLDDPALFRCWAYRIVTNKANDWLRRQRRERQLLDKTRQEFADTSPSQANTAADQEDVRARVHRGVRQLHSEQRALLSMFYVAKMSLAEIARALQIPLGTVKSRLHNIRQELKSILESEEEESG